MDAPGGPLDRNGVEVEVAEKGHAFDEMWRARKRQNEFNSRRA